MNLFILPSWYPTFANPVAGSFVREQAVAIADLCPDIRVIVSTGPQCDIRLNFRQPLRALSIIRSVVNNNRGISEHNRIFEVSQPSLAWTEKLPGGGIVRPWFSGTKKNLFFATSKFGKIDLIHAHVSFPAGFIAARLSEELAIPFVLTEHMSPFPFASMLRGDALMSEIIEAFQKAACRIAVSPSAADHIASFDLPRPEVVPNMVDERMFFVGVPGEGPFRFLTLGALSEQKGIDHLLHAIARWRPPVRSVEFLIGGDGPMRDAYQRLSQELGIADRVRWLGQVSREEAPRQFRECHAFVLPSRHESFGIVFAEALACGKPIIATRCGGPEFIINSSNGRLVSVGDVEGLAKTMEWMTVHWREFDALAIRRDFERRFARPVVVKQLMEIYQRVIANNA